MKMETRIIQSHIENRATRKATFALQAPQNTRWRKPDPKCARKACDAITRNNQVTSPPLPPQPRPHTPHPSSTPPPPPPPSKQRRKTLTITVRCLKDVHIYYSALGTKGNKIHVHRHTTICARPTLEPRAPQRTKACAEVSLQK